MSEPALPPVNVKAIARVALGVVALVTAGIIALSFGPLRDKFAPTSTSTQSPVAGAASGGGAAATQDLPAGQASGQGSGQVAGAGVQAPVAADQQGAVPAFDVVRVEPNGESVIAGRAAPHVEIELLADDGKGGAPQVLQRALTDSAGQFAFTSGPMQPGVHVLSLRAGGAGGSTSRQVVNITLSPPAPPLVALVAPDRPAIVLSSPDQTLAVAGAVGASNAAAKAAGQGEAQPAGAALSGKEARVVQVEADDAGHLFVVGKARPGATLRLYLNDVLLASGLANAKGVVEFAMQSALPNGAYRVRLDEVDPATGKVLSRAEAPWDRKQGGGSDDPARTAASAQDGASKQDRQRNPSDSAVKTVPVRTHVVARGDSLWSISRKTYQLGSRFTTIYDANHDQIADADRIYPGQVFVLPLLDGKAP